MDARQYHTSGIKITYGRRKIGSVGAALGLQVDTCVSVVHDPDEEHRYIVVCLGGFFPASWDRLHSGRLLRPAPRASLVDTTHKIEQSVRIKSVYARGIGLRDQGKETEEGLRKSGRVTHIACRSVATGWWKYWPSNDARRRKQLARPSKFVVINLLVRGLSRFLRSLSKLKLLKHELSRGCLAQATCLS